METAIAYGLPPISTTVFHAEIKVKKKAGKYFVENPIAHLGDRSDCEPMIEAQVQRAVDEIIHTLNEDAK
jgi:hypothetical protein